jgi:hypothetical protein
MRSLTFLKYVLGGAAMLSLAGCLVSETPVLDAKSGKAKPLKDGDYRVCQLKDDTGESECSVFAISRGPDGVYTLAMEGEEPALMRFRRVAAKAFAVQSKEGDDSYAYYFGAGDSKRFLLTMMNCQDIPPALRAKLIDDGDLSTEDEDFEVCAVNTIKGLAEAAKAYHRGETTGDDPGVVTLTPVATE